MNPIEIIDKFYPQDTEQRHILLIHSLSVAQKALKGRVKFVCLNTNAIEFDYSITINLQYDSISKLSIHS